MKGLRESPKSSLQDCCPCDLPLFQRCLRLKLVYCNGIRNKNPKRRPFWGLHLSMAKDPYAVLAEVKLALEQIPGEMLLLKKRGSSKQELRELGTQASVLFLELRQLNRIIFQEEDRVKMVTEAAKGPVDHITLGLHNLLYEKNHYLKAINTCMDFKSKYPDIELVPEEEFFRDAPEDMKGDPALRTDNHKLMLKRLHFELYQRKKLCRKRESLEAQKKRLQECIAARRKFMSSLPSPLKSLKKASIPVQQLLGIMTTDRKKLQQNADLLPAPLYIIYSQLSAQRDTFGEAIGVEISGSAREAHNVCRQLAKREADGGKGDDAGDDDDQHRRSRSSHRKSFKNENVPVVDLYRSHPLRISLSIYDDIQQRFESPRKLLTVVFEHLSKLNIVCAGIEGSEGSEKENLLAHLFPCDNGQEFPNQVSKVIAGDSFSYQQKPGLRPYKWAQQIAGIDCMPEIPPLLQLGSNNANGSTQHSKISAQSLIRLIRVHAKIQIAETKQEQDMEMR